MTAYETAQTITLGILITLGLAGLNDWFLIVAFAMITTAGVHALTGDDQ